MPNVKFQGLTLIPPYSPRQEFGLNAHANRKHIPKMIIDAPLIFLHL
jgi:hypothetical protein